MITLPPDEDRNRVRPPAPVQRLELSDLRGDPAACPHRGDRSCGAHRRRGLLDPRERWESCGRSAGETFTFVTQVDWSTVLLSDGWFPRQGVYDVRTLDRGEHLGDGDRDAGGRTARPGRRDLPLRVRHGLACARCSSPPSRSSPGSPAWCSGSSPSLSSRRRSCSGSSEPTRSTWSPRASRVGILSIPLVASVSEDALRSVPPSLREASYGMGARKITTVTQGRDPGCGVRARGRVDPRRVPGDRRDDGGVHRRWSGREPAVRAQPASIPGSR